jgi:hypothetical protein
MLNDLSRPGSRATQQHFGPDGLIESYSRHPGFAVCLTSDAETGGTRHAEQKG